MEFGAWPVAPWYEAQQRAGGTLNYGVSTGWVFARIATMTEQQPESSLEGMGRAMRVPTFTEGAGSLGPHSDGGS